MRTRFRADSTLAPAQVACVRGGCAQGCVGDPLDDAASPLCSPLKVEVAIDVEATAVVVVVLDAGCDFSDGDAELPGLFWWDVGFVGRCGCCGVHGAARLDRPVLVTDLLVAIFSFASSRWACTLCALGRAFGCCVCCCCCSVTPCCRLDVLLHRKHTNDGPSNRTLCNAHTACDTRWQRQHSSQVSQCRPLFSSRRNCASLSSVRPLFTDRRTAGCALTNALDLAPRKCIRSSCSLRS